MFYADGKLQYTVRVDSPNPLFAKHLQQAIGGVEGEIRVAMQYLFQAFSFRGPRRYRDLLLHTATEELAHIEMLCHAVALNLEGAKGPIKAGVGSKRPDIQTLLGGMLGRHYLSSGLGALPVNADGLPFDASHVYMSGNLAADMYTNVAAEASGRTLAARLHTMTDDPGMKDMLSFLIARDTMHQNQWLAVLEEQGGTDALPIPDTFPQTEENSDVDYAFVATNTADGPPPPDGRWARGRSIDGHGEFHTVAGRPIGGEPVLPTPTSELMDQQIQVAAGNGSPQLGSERPEQQGGGMIDKMKDRLS